MHSRWPWAVPVFDVALSLQHKDPALCREQRFVSHPDALFSYRMLSVAASALRGVCLSPSKKGFGCVATGQPSARTRVVELIRLKQHWITHMRSRTCLFCRFTQSNSTAGGRCHNLSLPRSVSLCFVTRRQSVTCHSHLLTVTERQSHSLIHSLTHSL